MRIFFLAFATGMFMLSFIYMFVAALMFTFFPDLLPESVQLRLKREGGMAVFPWHSVGYVLLSFFAVVALTPL